MGTASVVFPFLGQTLVSYAAVVSVVTGALRDNTKNGCLGDYNHGHKSLGHQIKKRPPTCKVVRSEKALFIFPSPTSPQNNVEIMWRGRLIQNQHCIAGGKGEMNTKITFQQDT